MSILGLMTRRCAGAAALALTMGTAATGTAQELTLYGVGSADGDGTSIALLGGSLRPTGLGIKPVVALQAYRLQYDLSDPLEDGDATVFGITPSAGVQYRGTGGSLEGRVGYSFQDREVEAPFIEGEGGSSGVVTSIQANSWATRPELQGIASYNWRSDFLWSQAQAVLPVMQLDPGAIGVGADLIYQADLGDSVGESYRAVQVGPVVRYNDGRSLVVAVGAGYKSSNVTDDTYYGRITVVRYGITF